MKFEKVMMMLKGIKISYKYMIDISEPSMPLGHREDLEDAMKEIDRAVDVLKAQAIIEQNT